MADALPELKKLLDDIRPMVYKEFAWENIKRSVLIQGMGEEGYAIYANFIGNAGRINSIDKFNAELDNVLNAIAQSNLSNGEKASVIRKLGSRLQQLKTEATKNQSWVREYVEEINRLIDALNNRSLEYVIQSNEAARA